MFSKYEYLKPYRLSDLTRLITVLAVEEKWSFRKNEGLTTTLNGNPKSSTSWFNIAKEHPEFFKFNLEGDTIVLLLRFLNRKEDNSGKEIYLPLTIEQTQKLVDQAILLHDKQIARFQKNSFLVPLLTALIAALTTGLVTYLTIINTNSPIKELDKKLERMGKNIDDIINKNEKSSAKIDSIYKAVK